MKKALTIILIVLAGLHIAGIAPFYLALLTKVKNEALLELKVAGKLRVVLVSNEDYHNPEVFEMKDGHEFKYRGAMYDFCKVKQTAQGREYLAIEDHKEDLLLDWLTASFNHTPNKSTHQNPLTLLLKTLAKDYLPENIYHFNLFVTVSPLPIIVFNLNTTQHMAQPLSPPPDFCS